MLLNHINQKMPIYKDCTLGEMLAVGGITLIMLSLILSLITKLLFNFAWIGIAIAILALVHVTRFILGRLQKLKYGKPDGYYQQLLLKKLSHQSIFSLLIKSPYLTRQGKWSVRRKI